MSQHTVTTRPRYAYPQHLQSLCHQSVDLWLENQGEFETQGAPPAQGSRLLLSLQLLPDKPSTQRLYQRVSIRRSEAGGLLVTAVQANGSRREHVFAADDVSCSDDGELQIKFATSSYYLWASMGIKHKTLALWTNRNGELILHNRWQENLRGVVGGNTSGDAWARFVPSTAEVNLSGSLIKVDSNGPGEREGAPCPSLTGDYDLLGQVIHLDGTLVTRNAIEQFFIEEDSPPPSRELASYFNLQHDAGGPLVLTLHSPEGEMVQRLFAAGQITCGRGVWQVRGEKVMASAWLLMVASAGVHWENLTLWRGEDGSLLVEGERTMRAALFLVPMGDTQRIFVSFPLKSTRENKDDLVENNVADEKTYP